MPELEAIDNTELPMFKSIGWAFGTVMFGTYISFILYGIFLQQAYKYFRLYEVDAKWLKYLVVATIIQETIVTALHMHIGFHYFVDNFGNESVFVHGVWSLYVSLPDKRDVYHDYVQQVGDANVVPQSPTNSVDAYELLRCSNLARFRGITITTFEHMIWVVLAYNVQASTTDLTLTSTLIYILHRSRTGYHKTDTLINKLIIYAVSTGLVTTLFNLVSFALVHVYGVNNFVWLGTMMVAERLYAISFITALNSRTFTSTARRAASTMPREGAYGTVFLVTGRSNETGMGEALELPPVDTDSNGDATSDVLQAKMEPERSLGNSSNV
ncbi:hypothetical protein C8Q80DRAFT_1269818 [Daedaleopsis nitida]|nr:hypothetical protein C8Q80DRAFT_1269818 [Daedaleopsis nitida]